MSSILAVLALAVAATPPVQAQTQEIDLAGRFEPVRVAVAVEATDGLGTMENDCLGYVGRAPVLVVRYRPGATPPRAIEVRLESETDTVLAVLAPGEQIGPEGGPAACSDDEGSSHDPLIRLTDPGPGAYRILAGGHDAGARVSGTLVIRPVD